MDEAQFNTLLQIAARQGEQIERLSKQITQLGKAVVAHGTRFDELKREVTEVREEIKREVMEVRREVKQGFLDQAAISNDIVADIDGRLGKPGKQGRSVITHFTQRK